MHTNLTYQPQPALCYISKTTALRVTTGTLSARNIQFNVTIIGVGTGRLRVAISNLKFTEQEIAT